MLGLNPTIGEVVLGQISVDTSSGAIVASQLFDSLQQSADLGVAASISTSQSLDAVTQTAQIGIIDSFAQDQTLGTVTQSTTIGVAVAITAPQELNSLTQSTATGPIATITVAQSLDSLLQSVSIIGAPVITASQTLDPIRVSVFSSSRGGAVGALVIGDDVLGGGTTTYTTPLQQAYVMPISGIANAQSLDDLYQFAGLQGTYKPSSHSYIIW